MTSKDRGAFYTPDSIAIQCVSFLLDHVPWPSIDHWIEPSAGGGAFVRALRAYGIVDVTAIDIAGGVGNIKTDFLTWKPEHRERKATVVIGNPPFGRAITMLCAFFDHAVTLANYVGFVLPMSVRKPTFANRINRQFHIVARKRLGQHAFQVPGGHEHPIMVEFVVWKRRAVLRSVVQSGPKISPYFEFVNDHKDADFLIVRVGLYAGKVKLSPREHTTGNHYRIRINRQKLTAEQQGRVCSFSMLECEERFYTMNTRMGSITQADVVKEFHKQVVGVLGSR